MSGKGGCFKPNKDAGFSIVELIVVVSILAIASVPLMKSMSMSTKVNAKAQSIQNATSLGEKVMEEMKSLSMAEIRKKYGPTGTNQLTDNGTNIVINLGEMTATQGETFATVVTIDKASYSGLVTPGADKKTNVASANTLRIPTIEEIDTLSQAVLTSSNEFNKYDIEAQNFFNQKLANYPTDTATITSKVIDIKKGKVTGAYPGVTVSATVTYKDDATPANTYVRDLYSGSFIPLLKDGSTDQYKRLDSNIYIFYKKSSSIPASVTETINITDEADYVNPDAPEDKDSHRVYFIRQDKNDTAGPVLNLNGTQFKYSDIATLDADGYRDFDGGKIRLVTNLNKGDITKEGHIYKEEARTRVYEITVKLSKGGEVYSELNSTKSASDTPTPTPTPTT
ncbi:MAG: type II secretion system protein [Lachnospiraceae bacterium]|nr:type II secretion system protein [Lachnospiraceae bacterium]